MGQTAIFSTIISLNKVKLCSSAWCGLFPHLYNTVVFFVTQQINRSAPRITTCWAAGCSSVWHTHVNTGFHRCISATTVKNVKWIFYMNSTLRRPRAFKSYEVLGSLENTKTQKAHEMILIYHTMNTVWRVKSIIKRKASHCGKICLAI